MIFPLRATVATPTFRPSHQGLAEELTSTQRAKILEKDVKEVAIKAAAASMALQIGLLYVPIIGWGIAGLIALVQYFTGKHYERNVKSIIANTKKALEAKASAADREVSAAMSMVYDQEYRSAVALAQSNVPLEGLGDFWSDTRDKVKKNVAPLVRKINMIPVAIVVSGSRAITSVALKAVAEGSSAVGAKGFARDVRQFEEKGDEIAKDIEKRSYDPKKASDLLSGKEMADTAERRAGELKATAFKEIDTVKASALALINSAEGREKIRKNTAMTLRGSPEALARMAQLDAEENALRASLNNDNAKLNNALDSMQPTISSINSTTALVGTGLAAAAAFLAFR